jgi:hypothetical protein
MSRAPLILSAAALFCASSYLALADERVAIGSAATLAVIQHAIPHEKRQDYPQYRHYRGYDESRSAMAVSAPAA